MRITLTLAALALLISLHASAAPRDAFEGKWTVTLTSDDGGKPIEDTLTFKAGKFTSEKQKAQGFGETEYELDSRGGQIMTFTATATSKKEGSAKWTGQASLGEISGSMTLTRADGSSVSYTYRGKKQEK